MNEDKYLKNVKLSITIEIIISIKFHYSPKTL